MALVSAVRAHDLPPLWDERLAAWTKYRLWAERRRAEQEANGAAAREPRRTRVTH